jgi:hypothetical protein
VNSTFGATFLNLQITSEDVEQPLSFQHACDLNWYGRCLLYQPEKTPLALWSKVLERSNTKPSVIFELLKGPAFAGTRYVRGLHNISYDI